ncbi:Imm45 family immunity protein [Pseudomonas sp. NPDC007930]|uniref:Imm45 family immunity protein n=1 Tax=Pseudomonas sp. NPDC007930 TaxID=3364417 RepID=UPI0036E2C694
MKRIRLQEFPEDVIPRGSLLRVQGAYPYEKSVDFMLFDSNDQESPTGLMVTTGYKAGLTLVLLPKEAAPFPGALSKAWLVKNWDFWVYPECQLSNVLLIFGYDADGAI